jgi:hypothetical protein
MAFDPDKFIGDSGGFDPDKFIANTPEPAPPPAEGPTWRGVLKNVAMSTPPALALRVAHSAWTDPAGTLQTADDAVRAAANAATFGGADRFAGYMNSGGPQTFKGMITGQGPPTYSEAVDAEVKKSEEARARSPTASAVGDLAGAAAVPGFGAEALAARWGGNALARAGAYGLTGAATGAAQGAGNTYSEKPSDYLWNAGIGGGVGLVTGAGGGAVFGARPSRAPAAATIPEQRATSDMAYGALRANPTRYDPAHFAQRANDLEQNFYTNPNFITERQFSPASFRTLDRMREPQPSTAATGGITPGQIDLSRQLLNNASDKTDIRAARYVRRGIDDFVENPPVGAVLPGAGNAQSARDAAAQALLARQSHAGAERSQVSENLRRKAEAEAGSRNSGLNVEAKLRSAYADFTKPNVKTGRSRAQNAGFNADEIGGMERFHSGADTPLRNTIRYLGNLGGGGGGLGTLAAAGLGIGGSAAYASDDPRWFGALALPAVGLGGRVLGNRIARQNINALDEMIRSRNPTSQYIQRTQPRIPGGGSAADAKMARDLIALELAKQRMSSDAP